MKQHLTERTVKAMVPEIDRDVLVYDDEVTGFAICLYRSGKRAFVLRYRIAGRARHFTIGSWPDWSVTAAREDAKRLKREVDAGNDPLGNRIDHRNAPTMSDLIDRYPDRTGRDHQSCAAPARVRHERHEIWVAVRARRPRQHFVRRRRHGRRFELG
jgi:hypothetical protein